MVAAIVIAQKTSPARPTTVNPLVCAATALLYHVVDAFELVSCTAAYCRYLQGSLALSFMFSDVFARKVTYFASVWTLGEQIFVFIQFALGDESSAAARLARSRLVLTTPLCWAVFVT